MRREKKPSILFWSIFWIVSVFFLVGFYVYLNRDQSFFANNAPVPPHATTRTSSQIIEDTKKTEESIIQSTPLSALMTYFLQRDGQERVFLVLMQNNLEIRPGGGYIGTFGILGIRDGERTRFEMHDTSNFDGRIPDDELPPYPMGVLLNIPSWKLRDSNWSPDFAVNAQKAIHFYNKGGGGEKFDGVIGVSANILHDVLALTGPITIPGYPGEYTKDNAVLNLEHQVEQGFVDQGIEVGERKSMMNLLAQEISDKINLKNPLTLVRISTIGLHLLKEKDVQLYFTDATMQKKSVTAGWSGAVNRQWKKDYLMLVDANLNALKSDAVMKRSITYTTDMTGDTPRGLITITYTHGGTEYDWKTKDYQTYMRVLLAPGTWVESVDGIIDEPRFGTLLDKRVVGGIVQVPLGSTHTVTIVTRLAEEMMQDYDLLVQKQPGIEAVPFVLKIIRSDTDVQNTEFVLRRDQILSTLQ